MRCERLHLDRLSAVVVGLLIGWAGLAQAAVIRVDVDTVAVTASVVPMCGDGACNGTETNASCSGDCPSSPPPPSCGDAVCNGTETCATCAADCGVCPPSGCAATPRLLAFGDSITLGVADAGGFPFIGWRKPLQLLLTTAHDWVGRFSDPAGDTTFDIQHWGVSGLDTVQALDPAIAASWYGYPGDRSLWRIAYEDYLPKPNPACSKVLLHLGTNDAIGTRVLSDSANNVLTMVNALDAYDSSVQVYVALVPPGNHSDPATQTLWRQRIADFNNALKPLIQNRQATKANLYLVDIHAAFLANPNWATQWMDGSVHPSQAGYQKMAEVWKASVQP